MNSVSDEDLIGEQPNIFSEDQLNGLVEIMKAENACVPLVAIVPKFRVNPVMLPDKDGRCYEVNLSLGEVTLVLDVIKVAQRRNVEKGCKKGSDLVQKWEKYYWSLRKPAW